MTQPVVHFEIIGRDPDALRAYYEKLFGWESSPADAASTVSEPGRYSFHEKLETPDHTGIPGGFGGGPGFSPHTLFYVGVEDVEEALQRAESLGGRRIMGPAANPNGTVTVGQFTDPEGNLVGVAGQK